MAQSAQALALGLYGEPGEKYQSKYMELWHISEDFYWVNGIINTATGKPLEKIFINRDFKTVLHTAFTDLKEMCLHKEIKTFDGCFNERSVRGRQSTSMHAWGLAIDLNAAIEKMEQENTYWSHEFIQVMQNNGLYWGGAWKSRKDSMHWSMFNG